MLFYIVFAISTFEYSTNIYFDENNYFLNKHGTNRKTGDIVISYSKMDDNYKYQKITSIHNDIPVYTDVTFFDCFNQLSYETTTKTITNQSFNYDYNTDTAIEPVIILKSNLRCNDCFVDAEASYTFEIDMNWGSLDYFKFAINTDSHMHISLEMDNTYTYTYSKNFVDNIHIKSFTIFVYGVPLKIDLKFSLDMNLDADLIIDKQLIVSAEFALSSENGIEYNGVWNTISEHTMNKDISLPGIADLYDTAIHAGVKISIIPTVYASILGESIKTSASLAPYGEVTININDNRCDPGVAMLKSYYGIDVFASVYPLNLPFVGTITEEHDWNKTLVHKTPLTCSFCTGCINSLTSHQDFDSFIANIIDNMDSPLTHYTVKLTAHDANLESFPSLPDPYVAAYIVDESGKKHTIQTNYKANTRYPVWESSLMFYNVQGSATIYIQVWDDYSFDFDSQIGNTVVVDLSSKTPIDHATGNIGEYGSFEYSIVFYENEIIITPTSFTGLPSDYEDGYYLTFESSVTDLVESPNRYLATDFGYYYSRSYGFIDVATESYTAKVYKDISLAVDEYMIDCDFTPINCYDLINRNNIFGFNSSNGCAYIDIKNGIELIKPGRVSSPPMININSVHIYGFIINAQYDLVTITVIEDRNTVMKMEVGVGSVYNSDYMSTSGEMTIYLTSSKDEYLYVKLHPLNMVDWDYPTKVSILINPHINVSDYVTIDDIHPGNNGGSVWLDAPPTPFKVTTRYDVDLFAINDCNDVIIYGQYELYVPHEDGCNATIIVQNNAVEYYIPSVTFMKSIDVNMYQLTTIQSTTSIRFTPSGNYMIHMISFESDCRVNENNCETYIHVTNDNTNINTIEILSSYPVTFTLYNVLTVIAGTTYNAAPGTIGIFSNPVSNAESAIMTLTGDAPMTLSIDSVNIDVFYVNSVYTLDIGSSTVTMLIPTGGTFTLTLSVNTLPSLYGTIERSQIAVHLDAPANGFVLKTTGLISASLGHNNSDGNMWSISAYGQSTLVVSPTMLSKLNNIPIVEISSKEQTNYTMHTRALYPANVGSTMTDNMICLTTGSTDYIIHPFICDETMIININLNTSIISCNRPSDQKLCITFNNPNNKPITIEAFPALTIPLLEETYATTYNSNNDIPDEPTSSAVSVLTTFYALIM